MSETDCMGNCKKCGTYIGGYTLPQCPRCDAHFVGGSQLYHHPEATNQCIIKRSLCPICNPPDPPQWALDLAAAVRKDLPKIKRYMRRYEKDEAVVTASDVEDSGGEEWEHYMPPEYHALLRIEAALNAIPAEAGEPQ